MFGSALITPLGVLSLSVAPGPCRASTPRFPTITSSHCSNSNACSHTRAHTRTHTIIPTVLCRSKGKENASGGAKGGDLPPKMVAGEIKLGKSTPASGSTCAGTSVGGTKKSAIGKKTNVKAAAARATGTETLRSFHLGRRCDVPPKTRTERIP